MKKQTLSFAAASLAFGAAVAIAGNTETTDADWQTKLEAKFATIDVDADGAVSEAEYLDYKMAEAKAAFVAMGGEDGAVTLEEAKAAYLAEQAEDVAATEDATAKDGEDS